MPPSPHPLRGKNILFINSGSKKKKFTLEKAKKLGVNVILVNRELDVNKTWVSHFVKADTYNHDEVVEKLTQFVEKNPDISLDGAITFWEDDVPLLARVCEEFDLVGNSNEAALMTRNKHEMRKKLKETGLGSAKFHLIKSHKDLSEAIKEIGFPAVMKPAWGADSEFVVLARNEEEAHDTFDYFLKNCNEQFNPIFKVNDGAFLYEEYMDGMEISLECFVQYGIPHVIGIHEKQPIKPPYFLEYGDIAPARIDQPTESEAIKLAESALIALGVRNSLAHIEIKITRQGPKIVEVGSRMGGDDIYSNVKQVWGADMIEIGLQIAAGQKANYKKRPAKGCVICRYFIPEFSGIVTQIENLKEAQKLDNVLALNVTKNIGDAVLAPPEGFDNMGWAITKGETYQEGETVMNRLMRKMEINITKFHRDSLLGKTGKSESFKIANIVRTQILKASRLERLRAIDFEALKKVNIGLIENALNPIPEIEKTFRNMGYTVHSLDFNEMGQFLKKLQKGNVKFALNLFEDSPNASLNKSHVAAFMEVMQIPYTGSTPQTLGLALDKIKVKKMLEYHEIPTPEWDFVEELSDKVSPTLKYPLIVKPANADHSLGINNQSVVTNEKELKKQIEFVLTELKRPALIEEYIDGTEYDICLLGNGDDIELLPKIRSDFKSLPKGYWHVYSSDLREQELKRIKVERPAHIPPKLNTLLNEISLDIFNIFDCNDYAKLEIRVDKNGNPYVLELNPNPEIDPDSFIFMAAQLAGYTYEEFLEELLYITLQRYKDHSPFYRLRNE